MEILGGAERVCANLCNALCTQYEVHLINQYKNNSAYKLDPRVKIYFLNKVKKKLRYTIWYDIINLRKYLLKNNISVVVSNGRTSSPILPLAVMNSKIKIIQCEHQSLSDLQYKRKTEKILNKYIFPGIMNCVVNKVVALTQQDMKMYGKIYKIPKNRLASIYNFIDEKLFESISKYNISSKKIITVGRFDYAKGYEYLIEVAKRVFEKYPAWQWYIYGEGDQEYKLKIKTLIKDENLESKVILMGNKDNIYELYNEYSFLVMTSRYEGLPMTLLEAKAKKLPLVSFDIESGPSEIIRSDIDGFLVQAFDTEEMSCKICNLIENPELRQKFSDNAQGNLDKFSKEKIMKQWCDLIESVE